MKIKYVGVAAIVALVGCYTLVNNKQDSKMLNVALNNVIEYNDEITNLDELLDNEGTIRVIDYRVEKELPYKEAVEKLEYAVYLSDKIEEIDKIKNHELIRDLNDKEKQEAHSLTPHDVALLVNEYNDEKTSIARKNDIIPMLNYLNTYNKLFVYDNGINISESILSKAVQQDVCNYLNDKDYNNCTIEKVDGLSNKYIIKHKNKKYLVNKNSILKDSLSKINDLRSKKKLYLDDYRTIRNDTVDSFNLVKYNVASNIYKKKNNLRVKENKKELKSRYTIG